VAPDNRNRSARRLVWLSLLLAVGLGACAPRLSPPARHALLDHLFAPPTEAERATIRREWAASGLPPVEQVRIEWEKREVDGRRTLVVSHVVEGARHFGAVRIPHHPAGRLLPVLVVAHGGDRGASGYHFFRGGPLADDWIQVVPSFRSEPLYITPFRVYRSEGISNPWAGDVTDAMALLGAVLQTLPQADSSRVAVFGHSRGGGVALLMGIRDPRVKAVVSIAAPTDLFLPEVRRIADWGLRWPLPRLPGANVLADSVLFAVRDSSTTHERARLELLRRSPAWFPELLPPTQIHHGERDGTVAFAHVQRLRLLAERFGPHTELEIHSYPDGGHRTRTLDGAIRRAETFLTRVSARPPPTSQPRSRGRRWCGRR
jgi:dipeptidyl aminopeptidase/acylaminoacyl peptidase